MGRPEVPSVSAGQIFVCKSILATSVVNREFTLCTHPARFLPRATTHTQHIDDRICQLAPIHSVMQKPTSDLEVDAPSLTFRLSDSGSRIAPSNNLELLRT